VNYWWVNHKQTAKQELVGGYLWAPTAKVDGRPSRFYDALKVARPGDMVFSFANSRIGAVGEVTGLYVDADKPAELERAGESWARAGWRLPVKFTMLSQPLHPASNMEKLRPYLPTKYSPIRENGHGNQQVYLAEIGPLLAKAVLDLIESKDTLSFLDTWELDDAAAMADLLRRKVPETQRLQLIEARVGQGKFRSNVRGIEPRCRITGISDDRFLIASHIQPWSKSSDEARLDGNNGLLLAAHVDHLFDKGYITFEDNGHVRWHDELPQAVMAALALPPVRHPMALNDAQKAYMAYHRNQIFSRRKRAG
jgi:hypothetical protein